MLRVRNKFPNVIYANRNDLRLSGDAVKIAQLGAREKMAPLRHGKLANRAFGLSCVADNDEFTRPCDLYALAIIACAEVYQLRSPAADACDGMETPFISNQFGATTGKFVTCWRSSFAF